MEQRLWAPAGACQAGQKPLGRPFAWLGWPDIGVMMLG